MARLLRLVVLVPLAGLVAGCGQQPPAPGELTVLSQPTGAAISLDGHATAATTPHTFTDLEGGIPYTVSVALDGWIAWPAQRRVTVPYGGNARVDFALTQSAGSLVVTSDPAGAAIALDCEDTGEVTPHTFAALPAGDYLVTVSLADHLSQPPELLVTVETGGTAAADFTLVLTALPRIVLLEGFSNVYCVGCPAMNSDVEYVLEQPRFGPDRLLYIKWPGANPSPLDPFHWVTREKTNARVSWYFGSEGISLPSLTGDGALLGYHGTPFNAAGIMAHVDEQPQFAEVSITVIAGEDLADMGDLQQAAVIRLLSPGGIDLTGHRLHAVLVYETVTTQNTSYQGGITVYHWVVRDHLQPGGDLGRLEAGQSYPFDVEFTDPLGGELSGHAVYPQAKQIIAWIQQATAPRSVIQAGSTMTPAPGAAGKTPRAIRATPAVHPGGSR